MLDIIKKPFKINSFWRTSIFILLLASLFFYVKTNVTYAQYYQVGNYTYVNNYSNLSVTTTTANNITENSVIMNGLVNGSSLYNTYNIETWFQYGTNNNLQYSTVRNTSNSGYANFSATVSNLNSNTIYYFRAVAQTPQGIVYGGTNSFRTNYATTTNITTTENSTARSLTTSAITTPASSVWSSGVQLNAFIINQAGTSGTTWFEYGTTSNLGSMTTPVSTGSFPSIKHVHTLSRLASGTTYYFRAVVANPYLRSDGAILSFTTSGVKQNTIQNTTTNTISNITSTDDTVSEVSSGETNSYLGSLGANVFSSGSFLPINIFGWLILFILILILILIIRHPQAKF